MGWTTGVSLPVGKGKGFFIFATESRPTLEPTEPFIEYQWPSARNYSDRGVNLKNLPLSNYEVNNAWSYTSTLPYVFMAWCLTK